MRNLKAPPLEKHPVTDTVRAMFDELVEQCAEVLDVRAKLDRTDRASEEFYRLMARPDTLLMTIGLTSRHLRAESERMDEMFEKRNECHDASCAGELAILTK
jgi:hypothetical protein